MTLFEDVVKALLSADTVIISFEILYGEKNVNAIVTVRGDELALFHFEDDEALNRSPQTSADLMAAIQSLKEHVVLQGPISVEATTTWTTSGAKPRVAVHGLTLSETRGKSVKLSRDGAVYTYSMSLSINEMAAV
jgi:hypothetical protein